MKHSPLLVLAALSTACAFATDGTYTSSTNTAWNTASGWVDGFVAAGAGSTATIDRTPFTAGRTVTQQVTMTLGNLIVTGSNSAARSFTLTSSTTSGAVVVMDNNGSASLIENKGWGSAQINMSLVLNNDLNLRNTPVDSSGNPASAFLGFGASFSITPNNTTLRTITILPSLITTSTPQNFRVAMSGDISGNIAIRQNSGNNLNLQERAKSYYGGLYIKSGNVNSSGLGSAALGASNNHIVFEARDSVADAVGTLNFTGTLTLSGSEVVGQSLELQTDGIVSVGLAAGSLTWAGQISGTGSFTKIGESALTLTANNAYTGDTVIGAGQLVLGANNAINAASDLVFATVSTVSAVLDANGHSNTFGTLSLQGAGVIDLGDVTGNVLTFADSADIAWGAYTLSIIGAFEDGASIRVGTDATGLTAEQLAKISINGENAYLTGTGFLTTAIPEPAVAALLTGALALALAARRRRD